MANKLGISQIYIHQYASVLSAYGLALADVVEDISEPAIWVLNEQNVQKSNEVFSKLK